MSSLSEKIHMLECKNLEDKAEYLKDAIKKEKETHAKTRELIKHLNVKELQNIKLKFEMYENEIKSKNKQIELLEENNELLRLENERLKSKNNN